METTRQNKIARLLQKELSDIFQKQTRATHGVIVSVTACRISPDLSICRGYLSVFPPERANEIVQNINDNVSAISCVSSPSLSSLSMTLSTMQRT